MPPAWKTEGVTRPKPTKHFARQARQARRDRAGQPASPHPATTPTAPDATPTSPATSPRYPESASAGLVIADLALHTVRATPAALPDVLLARCEWAGALPPAARRQFADATARALRLAAPGSLQDELAGVLATWHDTARSFGAA